MATAYEIQVTEAYIGLLGRAPDPAGLAYWVAQLDAAVTAGQTATLALKKLTNDIANSTEFTTGTIGTQVPASGSPSQAQADSIVTSLYDNLFDRAATQADKDFWTPQLTGGSTTAPEMTLNLITAAKANTAKPTDSQVLGYKQEAATYYVETVPQADFTRGTATSSVSAVNGPVSLQTSKDATNALATGTGNSLVVGTDTITMTLGDDTVTGTVAAGQYVSNTTSVVDASQNDADTLTLAATGDFDLGTTTNVETMNINVAAAFAEEFDINLAKVTGTNTLNLTTAETVNIAGVDVGGQLDIDLNNASMDINLTGVQDVDIDFDTDAATENVAYTVNADAKADTITITGGNDAGITLIMANDAAGSQSVSVAGEDGTNDAVTVSANNTVALNLNQSVADVTLIGNTNEVTYTITNTDNATPADSTITLTGSQNVTIKADADELTGSNLVNSATGTETINVTASTGTALDLSKAALVDNVELSFDAAGDTVTVKSGQAVELSANQTGVLIIEEAGTAAAGGSLAITLDGGTDNAFTASEINTDHFESLSVNAGNFTVTGLEIDTGDQTGNDADVTVVGTNDISFGADGTAQSIDAAAENITVSGKSLTFAGDVNGNDISLTATAGGITATAENAVAVDGGSIAISATNKVAFATVDADGGDIDAGENVTISGNDVDVSGIIRGYDVTLTATNDSETSTLGGILTVGNDLKFTDGGWDVNAAINVTNTLTISGDAEVDVAGGVTTATAGVVITSTNDVSFEGTLITPVLNASSASGAISVDFDGNTAAVTSLTGSGNDIIELDDGVVFTVNSGDGVDTITVTDVAAGTVINSAGGADVIDDNDDGVIFTVSTGAGNDAISVVANSDATYDGGDDTDTITIATGNYADDTFVFKNMEKVTLGGAITIDSVQLDNDNTFLMSGASAVTVLAEAADTVDLSNITFDPNAIGSFVVTGSAGVDVITGSAVVDLITGNAGNDTVTLGTGADKFNYDTGTDGVDTFTDFTTTADTYVTDFQTKKSTGASAVVTTAGYADAALTINTAVTDVQQVTGATLALADASNEQAVINAISNGTVSITAASDKALLSVVTATNTYLYEVTAAAGNTDITAADDAITLVGIFTNGVTFATNDIDENDGA